MVSDSDHRAIMNADCTVRSLTKRQRGLLQAYVDDVEGHSSRSSGQSSSTSKPNLDGAGTQREDTDNGTTSRPSPSGDRMFSIWRKMRKLIGI